MPSLQRRGPLRGRILGSNEYTRRRKLEGERACNGAQGLFRRQTGLSVHLYNADLMDDWAHS